MENKNLYNEENVDGYKKEVIESKPEFSNYLINPWAGGCGLCITGCFCPCIVYGRTAQDLYQDEDFCYHCMNNAGCFSCCETCCSIAKLRRDTRRKRKIPGTFLIDIFLSFCCTSCTLIQVRAEVKQKL